MKVIEHLNRASEPLISFEIIPPKRGGNFSNLEEVIADIAKYNPPFIDVTSHAAVAEYIDLEDGKHRRVLRRKRPGTLGICSVIQHKYGIDAIPHLLCTGFTREETEDLMIDLNYLGIDNVLAIRGDKNGYQKPVPKGKTRNIFAVDLVHQISDMNHGIYLVQEPNASPTNFCIGVAGYPEKHFEAPNIEIDILNLKKKVDAGASYVVSQLGFDNIKYFS
ncbi:methylenetetrahydrofolate reductase, partial [Candidatus Woesearchaeota archaeon]|nr:methylenetetrahydrofolate reductase [Candidatus Woesearchaeota archaeon]